MAYGTELLKINKWLILFHGYNIDRRVRNVILQVVFQQASKFKQTKLYAKRHTFRTCNGV